MAGEFEKLLPFKWRDGEYPVTDIVISLAHDLVEHKYWGVDGANVEDTGVEALRITASIPLVNHIYPGINEKWEAGKLYPTALRKLFVDFGKKTAGPLQHPEWGVIVCKADKLECRLAGDRRGHAQIEASWIQTADPNLKATARLNPLNQMSAAAGDLDASDEDLRALAPQIPKWEDSLEDLANGIAAVGDQISILQSRAAGRIGAVVYRAELIAQSAERARSPMTWPAAHASERIKEAAASLRDQLAAANKALGMFSVRDTTTLAGVVSQLPSNNTGIADLIKLNPRLVAAPTIPAGALVRYYLAA